MPTVAAEPEPKIEKNIESGYNPIRKDPSKERFSINLADQNIKEVPSQPSAHNPYAPSKPASNPYAPS